MLKNFKLVDTEGKSGVFYKGRTIPFDKIDDAKAEELMGKTHMLERVAEAPAGEAADDKKKELAAGN